MLILDFPPDPDFVAEVQDKKENTIADVTYLQKIWPRALVNNSDSKDHATPHKRRLVHKEDLLGIMTKTYLPNISKDLEFPPTEAFLQGLIPVQECSAAHGDLKELLKESTLKPSSQKIYRSEINSRLNNSRSTEPHYPHKTLHLIDDMGVFFEYLEKRSMHRNLKNPIRSYRTYLDLIETRFLLYADAPSTQLEKVTLADIITQKTEYEGVVLYILQLKGQSYLFPESFVTLAQAVLSREESIIKKTTKERNRFVENIAKAAKIKGKFHPKSIQLAYRQLCSNYPRM